MPPVKRAKRTQLYENKQCFMCGGYYTPVLHALLCISCTDRVEEVQHDTVSDARGM